MALIKCTECGQEVSSKASSCPNCGCPIEEITSGQERNHVEKGKRKNTSLLLVLVVLLVCFIGGVYKGCYSSNVVMTVADTMQVDTVDTVEANRIDAAEVDNPILKKLINNMVYVEGGTFTMGATSEQGSDACDNEKPTHRVTLSSYYIGKYEVTQAEWYAVMGNDSLCDDDNTPIYSVSWDDCQEFIRKLNSLTGKSFRLPTEAEWEFAARGGNNSRGYKYSGSDDIGSVAWSDYNIYDNNFETTHPVGQKSPNELGLYDMSGNVYEWCQNWYGDYSSSSQTDPTGPNSGSERVYRGGACVDEARGCRVSVRNSTTPDYCDRYHFYMGLRLVADECKRKDAEIAYEKQREEERMAEEERIRREGVEKMVSLTVELTNNSHITSYHGSYGAIYPLSDKIFSKYIKIPDGKVWIYKKEELKQGFVLVSFLYYYSKGNPDKGVIYDYNRRYNFSDGDVPVLRSGDGFRICIDGPRGSLSENDSNNTVIYNVYFVEKDEEDYY